MIYSIKDEYENVLSWLNILEYHLKNATHLNQIVGFNRINKLLLNISSVEFMVRRYLKTDDSNHKFELGIAIQKSVNEIDYKFEKMIEGIEEGKTNDIELIIYELKEQIECLWVSKNELSNKH